MQYEDIIWLWGTVGLKEGYLQDIDTGVEHTVKWLR